MTLFGAWEGWAAECGKGEASGLLAGLTLEQSCGPGGWGTKEKAAGGS